MEAFTSSGNYLGTDRLKRALTDAESRQLGRVLREHGFTGASMIALRFAYNLTRSREGARDLLGRTNLRLVRWGWDPNAVSLVKCLCRLVWSEFTHQKSETARARHAEEAFLAEEAMHGEQLPAAPTRGESHRGPPEPVAPSPEQRIVRLEEEREDDARRREELARMRADLTKLRDRFRAQKDEVNQVWLEYQEKGVDDPATMARETGRDVAEFYAAQKRRARAMRRLVAERNGVPAAGEDEEKT